MMAFIIFIGCDRKRKAERRRLPDDMFCNTCKSTLLTHFFRNSSFTKKSLSFTTHLQNVSLASIGFLLMKHWDADIAVEEEMEKIVIQMTSSDEDTDTATECFAYSDKESADEVY